MDSGSIRPVPPGIGSSSSPTMSGRMPASPAAARIPDITAPSTQPALMPV